MKLKTKQRGAETVEFAIILPILLIILFGIMEYGIVLYDKAVITNASREGARSGIAYKCPVLSEAQIRAAVIRATSLTGGGASLLFSFASGATAPTITITPTPPTTTTNCFTNSGTPLTVTVTYSYRFLALGKLMSLFVPGFTNPIMLSSTTVMNYE